MQRKRSRGKRALKRPSSANFVGIAVTVCVVIVIVAVGYLSTYILDSTSHYPVSASGYKPDINPSDFTPTISNRYLHMKKGDVYLYEKQTTNGVEQLEISRTGKIKTIMGFRTLEHYEKFRLSGEVIQEITRYLAQDEKGNVWQFGEYVSNYDAGRLTDHNASWTAGRNGAQPGIVMKERPEVKDSFRQSYSLGTIEDTSDIIAVQETVTTPYGIFTDCVKTYDWTPLDPKLQNNSYYCPEIGGMALTVNLIEDTRVELVGIKMVQ